MHLCDVNRITFNCCLKFLDAPEAMSLSDSVVQVQEGKVPPSVECAASSWPPSTYMWRRGNIVLTRDDVLSFNGSVDRDHHGAYICVAENRHGRAQIEMTLEVLCKYFYRTEYDDSNSR